MRTRYVVKIIPVTAELDETLLGRFSNESLFNVLITIWSTDAERNVHVAANGDINWTASQQNFQHIVNRILTECHDASTCENKHYKAITET